MVSMSMTFSGDKRAIRSLERLKDRVDLRKIEPQLWRRFAGYEKQLFATEGASGPDGRWKALKPATIASKQRNGQNVHILKADLDLFKSVTVRNNENAIHRASRDSVVLGTKDPKAKFHQDPRGNKRPRRAPVAVTKKQRQELADDFKHFILTGGRRGA